MSNRVATNDPNYRCRKNHCSKKLSLLVVQILDQIRPEKTSPTTALRSTNTASELVEENIDPDGVGGDEDEAASGL